MTNSHFELNFKARRAFSSNKKKIYYLFGAVLSTTGILGLIKLSDKHSTFYILLIVWGLLLITIAAIGKYLRKESNHIALDSRSIRFKNLSQKPRLVIIDNLLDIVIDADKAEFITLDHQVSRYDFSVFSEDDKINLHKELDNIKLNLK